jgi:hypothetical protein
MAEYHIGPDCVWVVPDDECCCDAEYVVGPNRHWPPREDDVREADSAVTLLA